MIKTISLLLLTFYLTTCGKVVKTFRAKNCTVTETESLLIVSCPDGSVAQIEKEKLTGPEGVDGKDGADGKDGIDGKSGEQGPQGVPGEKGDEGEKGDTGEQGPVGPEGPAGKDGANGTDGKDGANAEPCTVYNLDIETIRIECPDGSYVDITLPKTSGGGKKK